MINVKDFVSELKRNNFKFAAGVPDSLTKDLCFELEKQYKKNHVTCANEGSAIAEGIGFYLKEKRIPIIYMQNSGLGNAINPLVSLAHKKTYDIPLFLIIGWRGELRNDLTDEPQHIKQGEITEKILKDCNIHFEILDHKTDYKKKIKKLSKLSKIQNRTIAFLVRKNTFKNNKQKPSTSLNLLTRENTLNIITKLLPKNSIVVSTTGILSRELNEINQKLNRINNFMCVGGMGHAVSIASGLAKKIKKKVFCFDGDGSFSMHLGSLMTTSKNKNLIHIVFNNESHESVGGHETNSKGLKLNQIASNLGYNYSYQCKSKKQIVKYIKMSIKSNNSFFLEILIKKGHRKNISRQSKDLKKIKYNFMKKIR